MISLVTQSDGSARRLPIVTLALAVAMAATFYSYEGETRIARGQAEAAIAEAVEYFEEYPYVALPDGMERYLSDERAEELRAAYQSEWSEIGLAKIPPRLLRRVQKGFDDLALPALAQFEALPANRHAFRSAGSEPIRFFDHVLYHAALPALLVSLVLLLLVGIPIEDSWGSVVFGLFCAAVVPLGAVLFGALHAEPAALWIGGSGLAAGLLGASVARWLDTGSPRLLGGIPLAAWWVVPAWFFAEYGAARRLQWDDFGSAPIDVHVAVAFSGIVLALAIRAFGLEEKLADRWDESKEPVRNPKLEEAMELRAAGNREEALTLLRVLFEKRPDPDVATAIWDISQENGTAEVGSAAALWRVSDALRRKQPESAMEYWVELTNVLDVIDAEPTLFVKLAELLTAAEREDEGLVSIDRMLGCGKPLTARVALHASRLVQERDPELAARVASAAIAGGGLSGRERKQLLKLVPLTAVDPGAQGMERATQTNVSGDEPLRVKTRVLPAFQGLRAKTEPISPSARASALYAQADAEPAPESEAPPVPDEPQLEDVAYDALDPNAISPDALGGEEAEAEAGAEAIGESQAADPQEIEKWNSPGLVEDLSGQLPDAERAVDASALMDAETPLSALAQGEPTDITGRQTRPILDDAPRPERKRKQVAAKPVSLDAQGLEIEVEGKGRTLLPFRRVEALAVGAVRDLSAKPVVVIDLVLNWSSDSSQTLKLLRIRSDRFDPRGLIPGSTSGLEALRSFLAAIVEGARPECLPDEGAARGEPFVVHDTLEQHEQETTG